MMKLTRARLTQIIRYNPVTGIFVWRITVSRQKAGCVAGWATTPKKHGGQRYLCIKIDRKQYQAHRLAWFYMTGEWPKNEIDHKDRNGLNNCWSNLREATRSQNTVNSISRSNRTGYRGVREGANGRFSAYIWRDGKQSHLGMFDTAEDAHNAYRDAARKEFGEFANP